MCGISPRQGDGRAAGRVGPGAAGCGRWVSGVVDVADDHDAGDDDRRRDDLGTAIHGAGAGARQSGGQRADIWPSDASSTKCYRTARVQRRRDPDVLAAVLTSAPTSASYRRRSGSRDACLAKDPRRRLRDIGDARAWSTPPSRRARGQASPTLVGVGGGARRRRWCLLLQPPGCGRRRASLRSAIVRFQIGAAADLYNQTATHSRYRQTA